MTGPAMSGWRWDDRHAEGCLGSMMGAHEVSFGKGCLLSTAVLTAALVIVGKAALWTTK